MAENVTTMRLKVDLQCPCCYKKVKKILCKFPQIQDQVYDEKQNLVTITVVCCSPEKIRDKLCCKGGEVIKSIEIVVPPPPPPPDPKSKSESKTQSKLESKSESKTEPEPETKPEPELAPANYSGVLLCPVFGRARRGTMPLQEQAASALAKL